MNALTMRAAQLAYDNQSPPEDDTTFEAAGEWADTLNDRRYAELAADFFDRNEDAYTAFIEQTVLPAWRQHVDLSNSP